MIIRQLSIFLIILVLFASGCTGFWNKVQGGKLEMQKSETEVKDAGIGENTTVIIIEPMSKTQPGKIENE